MKEFLRKKNIIFSAKRYGIDALGAMAQGLFASLLIGTIISTLGEQLGIGILVTVGGYAKGATGAAMAISIGVALQCPPLVLFSLAAVGMAANELGGAGGPLAVLVVTIFAAEFGKLVSKETKIDIIVTPFVTICVGVLLSLGCAPAIGAAASTVGTAIMWATELQPFFMGIIVSVIVGIALTLPISSAAICAALSLTGLAGGAAVAGCCAQMVGFAVMSFKENKWGGLFAQGIGTSMLQMGNIVRNPRIWLPPTLASAITGPVATCIFHLKMNGAAVASGMGTCGLVGQIGVYTGWVNDIAEGTKAAITGMDWAGLVLICFILPAVLSWAIAIPMRKCGWIKENDLTQDIAYTGELEFENICAVFNDMQESILAEQEKNRKYEKARTDMIAGISHDLRTPLTAMRGTVKGLMDGVASTPEQQKKFLQAAYRRTGDMDMLLNQLLYLSRMETGNMPISMQTIEIGAFLKSYVRGKQEVIETGKEEITADTKEITAGVLIDPEQFQRVLDNLVENSRKYSETIPLRMKIKLEKTPKGVSICFQDNGVGVPEEKLPYIFEEFYRGDESRNKKEGNGLGLYIVKYLMEAMGGSVRAENADGLAVYLELPISPERSN